MANFIYNTGAARMWSASSGAVDLLADTIKVMLVTSAYAVDRDHEFVSSAAAAEIVATNYTGGFAGAGRKTLASKTVVADLANDRAEFDAADVLWSAIGGATNATIAALVVIKEVTNDAASILLAYIDTTTGSPGLPFTTNGGDLTININAEGLLQLKTV